MADKGGSGNTRTDNGEESESGDDMGIYCDVDEGVANDDSGGGECIDEEEDSAMLGECLSSLVYWNRRCCMSSNVRRQKRELTDWLEFLLPEKVVVLFLISILSEARELHCPTLNDPPCPHRKYYGIMLHT